jgi:hypothetical protein
MWKYNVMISIEKKLSYQSGVNKLVSENRHVSLDPVIRGILLTENCYKEKG